MRRVLGVLFLFLIVNASAEARSLRVGFYAGTFDPPHRGHRRLVQQVLRELNLDVLYILPNVESLHKPNASPFEIRERLTHLEFDSLAKVLVSDREMQAASRESGFDAALEVLHRRHSEDEIFQIMGEDSFWRMLEWNGRFKAPNFHYVVSERGERKFLPAYVQGVPVIFLPLVPFRPTSSSEIREALLEGRRPRGLSIPVWNEIQKLNYPSCSHSLVVP